MADLHKRLDEVQAARKADDKKSDSKPKSGGRHRDPRGIRHRRLPAEQFTLRADTARAYSSADVEVGIPRVPARPFDGLGPAEIQGAAPIFHEAFRQAEREGYDAVVPLGMLDIGVDGGRSVVDIPVIAPLQAALHVAALVGDRFGVVCYHPSAIARHRAQCTTYGMEPWIAGRRASGFYVQTHAANKDRMIESFCWRRAT